MSMLTARFLRLLSVAGWIVCWCASNQLYAHESRPGFLNIHEISAEEYQVLWKKPSGGEMEIALNPKFPVECQFSDKNRQRQIVADALLVQGQMHCNGGLAGKTIFIEGLAATISDTLVRLHHLDGHLENHLLRSTHPFVSLGVNTSSWQRALDFGQMGVQHILAGYDHLLFVLGLLLLVRQRWMLFKTISAFTLAHSITLALATLGVVQAPVAPIEASIALSILFLGMEIIKYRRGETSLTIRYPWVVAFVFGLLHGFGFASGMNTMGLPHNEIPLALLMFNLGVEFGQIAFVDCVFLVKWLLQRLSRRFQWTWPIWMGALPAYLIGSCGAMWTIQRVLPIWG